MTTLDLQVGASAGDGHERDDGSNFSSVATTLDIVANTAAGTRSNAGCHFVDVTIPAGATIDVAYVTVNVDSTTRDDPSLDIFGNNVDDAVDFSAEADVTSRTRTTASAEWSATGIGAGEKNSPSIVSVIQEIIDRPGWASGNDIVILLDGKDAAQMLLRITAYDGSTTLAPKLHIEFTAGGGGGSQPPRSMHQFRMRRT